MGTKLKLAFETGIHETIGIDLVIVELKLVLVFLFLFLFIFYFFNDLAPWC